MVSATAAEDAVVVAVKPAAAEATAAGWTTKSAAATAATASTDSTESAAASTAATTPTASKYDYE